MAVEIESSPVADTGFVFLSIAVVVVVMMIILMMMIEIFLVHQDVPQNQMMIPILMMLMMMPLVLLFPTMEHQLFYYNQLTPARIVPKVVVVL